MHTYIHTYIHHLETNLCGFISTKEGSSENVGFEIISQEQQQRIAKETLLGMYV